jgi:hypothetical protein
MPGAYEAGHEIPCVRPVCTFHDNAAVVHGAVEDYLLLLGELTEVCNIEKSKLEGGVEWRVVEKS